MPRAFFARFGNQAAAEAALDRVSGGVSLLDSAIVSKSPAGRFALDNLQISDEERAACERELEGTEYLLVAQAEDEAQARRALALLEPAPASAEPPRQQPREEIEEERIPIVEEELRIGKREVRRGGARVRSWPVQVPVSEEVELAEEFTSIERRPVNRRLTEAEVREAGLLQERVVEVSRMREEAIVTKEAFVREELVVKKRVEIRREQINTTLLRTEVDTEELEGEMPTRA